MLHNYLIILRPKHWIKNLLIFFPVLFSPLQLESYAIQNSVIAFLLFCVAASSVYTFNDVMDYKKDKDNIRTKNRPIANGSISLINGIYLSIVLTILSCSFCLILLPDLFLFYIVVFLNLLLFLM